MRAVDRQGSMQWRRSAPWSSGYAFCRSEAAPDLPRSRVAFHASLSHLASAPGPPDRTSLVAVLYCTVMVPYDMTFDPPKGLAMTAIDIAIEMFFICDLVIVFAISPFVLHGRALLARSLDRQRDCQSEIAHNQIRTR